MHYLKFLEALHAQIQPRVYLEIGIRKGASFTLSKCRSIGVDPAYNIEFPLPADSHLFRAKSDDFFASRDAVAALSVDPIDFAFIDGWHNFEFALRDFFNTERFAKPGAIVVFDDVRPRNETEAVRLPHGGAWTGDVWKIIPCLERYRPDLELICVGTIPTGLLVVRQLDPSSTVLSENYDTIFHEFVESQDTLLPPPEVLERFQSPHAALEYLAK